MLGEAGSIASIVGLPLSLLALLFALYQLARLRGEMRAARAAAEEARRLFQRDLAHTDMTRLRGHIRGLVELHRRRDRERSLDQYSEIRRMLREVRQRHPNLSDEQRRAILDVMAQLGEMQWELETLEGDMTAELVGRFNHCLGDLQMTLLVELEDRLENTTSGD